LRAEKKRLLAELNEDLPERQKEFEQVVKTAFGKEMTFSEYLAKDKEYQAERAKKEQQQQQQQEEANQSSSNGSWFFRF
jgi:hypothetical protein